VLNPVYDTINHIIQLDFNIIFRFNQCLVYPSIAGNNLDVAAKKEALFFAIRILICNIDNSNENRI
jgi:hypothetical protein